MCLPEANSPVEWMFNGKNSVCSEMRSQMSVDPIMPKESDDDTSLLFHNNLLQNKMLLLLEIKSSTLRTIHVLESEAGSNIPRTHFGKRYLFVLTS